MPKEEPDFTVTYLTIKLNLLQTQIDKRTWEKEIFSIPLRFWRFFGFHEYLKSLYRDFELLAHLAVEVDPIFGGCLFQSPPVLSHLQAHEF